MEEILAKYFSGEATEEERSKVLQWRTENREDFLASKMAWSATVKVNSSSSRLEEIVGKVDNVRTMPVWLKYAATVLVLLAAILSIYYYNSDNTNYVSNIDKLPDGTKTILHKDSRIAQIEDEEFRKVKMEGRVYFDVKRMEDKPFIIETDQAIIEVLGTSFVVDAGKENTTEVIVESGTVALSQRPDVYDGRITRVTLNAGEIGIITPNAKGVIKKNNKDENYLSWVNRELVFKRTNLADVASLMDDVYGYQIVFDNSAIANCTLTATYEKKSPEQIARLISSTFGFTYSVNPDNRTIVFSGQSCQ